MGPTKNGLAHRFKQRVYERACQCHSASAPLDALMHGGARAPKQDTAASYGVGALGGLTYLRLLNKSVDGLGASFAGAAGGQARFAIPIILALGYNRCLPAGAPAGILFGLMVQWWQCEPVSCALVMCRAAAWHAHHLQRTKRFSSFQQCTCKVCACS